MSALDELPLYRCHKEVRAGLIVGLEATPDGKSTVLEVSPTIDADIGKITNYKFTFPNSWMATRGAKIGGYLVVYKDGYTSYSPAPSFEEGYTLVKKLEES